MINIVIVEEGCVLSSFSLSSPIFFLSKAAAETTYPLPEQSSTTILQLIANFASALLLPLFMALQDPKTQSMEIPNWLNVLCIIFTAGYVSLKRKMKSLFATVVEI